MKETLFKFNNPNRDILVVDTEDGQDEDDNMNSMIGDAVMRHVDKLGPAELMVWEEAILMGNQNIFRVLPNPEPNDPDPLNLRGKELKGFFKKHPEITGDTRKVYEEALEEERTRRAKSRDIYDRNEGMISFDDWAANPGMGSHVDIPTTPKPIYLYVGNVTQPFYDYFPEGHPDTDLINNVIRLLNRDPDQLTEKFALFLYNNVIITRRAYVSKALRKMVSDIITEEKDPEESIIEALTKIDNQWSKEYRASVVDKLQEDGIYQLLVVKYKDWYRRHKKGERVDNEVRTFGHTLYSTLRKDLKRHHWAIYKKIKKIFAGPVLYNGLDLNRARFSDLERKLDISRQTALKIIFGRPWISLDEVLLSRILLTRKPTQKLEKFLDWIEEYIDKAHSENNETLVDLMGKKIEELQRTKNNSFSSREWDMVWKYYKAKKYQK